MNFGDDVPGWDVLPYRLHVPTEHLARVLGRGYQHFLREAREDAERFPDDWPELEEVAALGYPPLRDLPTVAPAHLALVLRENLALELLDVVLPVVGTHPAPYLANSVDRVDVEPEAVTVVGRALVRPGVGPEAPWQASPTFDGRRPARAPGHI